MARNPEIRTDIVARDKTKAAFASVQRAMGALKKGALVVGAAVGAVGAAFVVAAKKTLEFADEIAKTADKIGFSTDALQELRVATDLAGISQGELDSALGAMSKRLGELRVGTGALNTFLLKFDASFAGVLKTTTSNDEAFRLIIQKINSLSNAQDKAALSAAAFGRTAGIALSKLSLVELEDGIRRARALGLVIDENLLRNAEKIKDEFTLAAKVIQVQFMSVMLKMMRDLDFKQLAKDLIELAMNAGKAALEIAKILGLISRPMSEQLARLKGQFEEANGSVERFTRLAKEAISDGDLASFKRYSEQLQLAQKSADGAARAIEKIERAIDKAKSAMEPLPPLPVATDVGYHAGMDPKNINQLAKTRVEVAGLNAVISDGTTPLGEMARAFENVELVINRGVAGALKSFEDALVNIGTETKSLSESFKSMASSIINDLKRMAIQKYVTGPLAGMLDNSVTGSGSGGFGQILTNIGYSMFGGPSTGVSANTFAATYPVGAFADGGYAASGRPALVGERGPELIVPGRRGATVYPNESLGGATIVNNYDFSGANPATVSLLRQEAERIKQETFSSVFQAIDRGGSYARISGRR